MQQPADNIDGTVKGFASFLKITYVATTLPATKETFNEILLAYEKLIFKLKLKVGWDKDDLITSMGSALNVLEILG